MNKPQVNVQGKVVVERDGAGGFLMMYPDGKVESWRKRETVERRAKAWFHINNDPARIGVGLIEWRL